MLIPYPLVAYMRPSLRGVRQWGRVVHCFDPRAPGEEVQLDHRNLRQGAHIERSEASAVPEKVLSDHHYLREGAQIE